MDLRNKQYMYRKWMLQSFNEGYIIVYCNNDNEITEVPFNAESYLADRELLEHIVWLHNKTIKELSY